MIDDVTEDDRKIALMTILAETPVRPSRVLDVVSGGRYVRRFKLTLASLEEQGLIERTDRLKIRITERGRIGCALLMAKDPSLRYAFID